MRDIGLPNGLADVGYAPADIPDLVGGAVKQQRLLSMAPRDVMPEDLEAIFAARCATGDGQPPANGN